MTGLTMRDKILAAFLPAGALLLFYPYFRPAGAATAAAGLAELQASAPSHAQLAAKRAELDQVSERAAETRQELTGHRERLAGYRRRFEARGATVERLGSLFRKHQLTIIREGPAQGSRWLPGPLEEAARLLAREEQEQAAAPPGVYRPASARTGAAPQVALREFEFLGTYTDVERLLRDLRADDGLIAAPVRLDMRAVDTLGDPRHVWILQVWL